MIAIPASLRSDFIHIPGTLILIALESTIHIVGIRTQLGSRDVQSEIVSFYPPDQVALDYGHFDLLTARSAPTIVWKKILSWLEDHQGDTSCWE